MTKARRSMAARRGGGKIAVILGTRPEIVKMSPILRYLQKTGRDFELIHSDQHYSHNMDLLFFRDLGLPEPHHRTRLRRGLPAAAQLGAIMAALEHALRHAAPRHVLVQGDTNTVLAGALVTNRLAIARGASDPLTLGHVEAGLRSFDRRMPEETNRILTDHLSDLLFAPTAHARGLLEAEGISRDRIRVTGNTVVDAVRQNLEIARKRSRSLETLGVTPGRYAVLTLHRPENVDRAETFRDVWEGVARAQKAMGLPVIFPVHPRTLSRMKAFGLSDARGVRRVEPVGYLDFMRLLAEARLALTDSGGVQEEACILGVPCVTLRDNTERPETVACGANRVAGTSASRIEKAARAALRSRRTWRQPFGDGRASERIVRALSGESA